MHGRCLAKTFRPVLFCRSWWSGVCVVRIPNLESSFILTVKEKFPSCHYSALGRQHDVEIYETPTENNSRTNTEAEGALWLQQGEFRKKDMLTRRKTRCLLVDTWGMFISAVCNMSCRRMNGRIETFLGRRCRPMFEVLIPSKYTDPAWENMPRSGTAVYVTCQRMFVCICVNM